MEAPMVRARDGCCSRGMWPVDIPNWLAASVLGVCRHLPITLPHPPLCHACWIGRWRAAPAPLRVESRAACGALFPLPFCRFPFPASSAFCTIPLPACHPLSPAPQHLESGAASLSPLPSCPVALLSPLPCCRKASSSLRPGLWRSLPLLSSRFFRLLHDARFHYPHAIRETLRPSV
jgi:hypothetical protein